MISKEVVIQLITLEDRRINLFDPAHDFFAVSDFNVQTFHFVIIVISLNEDVSNVRGTRCDSSPKFLFVSFVEIHSAVTNENVGLFTRDFFSFFEQWSDIFSVFVVCYLLSYPKL